MCCIIHRPKDASKVHLSDLEKIIRKNPDGWGISYIRDGELFVEKSIDMTKAIDAIRKAEELNVEFLFHARWATHGEKNEKNCHPFPIHNGVMFHNGKMDLKGWNQKMSDSWHFSHKVTKLLQKKKKSLDFVTDKFKHLIRDSRLAFMLQDGTIIKYGKWHTIGGSFFSKLDWQYHTTTSSNNYSGGCYSSGNGWSYWEQYDDVLNPKKSVNKPLKSEKDFLTVDEVKNYKRITRFEQIQQIVEQGLMSDTIVHRTSLAELAKLNADCPVQMGTYLFELIHRI